MQTRTVALISGALLVLVAVIDRDGWPLLIGTLGGLVFIGLQRAIASWRRRRQTADTNARW